MEQNAASASRPSPSDPRAQASARLRRLAPEVREALLIDCWMAHDARWFNAVTDAFGVDAANAVNLRAAAGLGRAEARRVAAALQLPPITGRDSFLALQETIIALSGPELLDYRIDLQGEDSYDVTVERCFAFDHVSRAGVAGSYRCGIFARVEGWLDATGLPYTLTPSLGPCLKARGQACVHRIAIPCARPAEPAP